MLYKYMGFVHHPNKSDICISHGGTYFVQSLQTTALCTAAFLFSDKTYVRATLKEITERPDDHRGEWRRAKYWRQMMPGNSLNHFVHQ